jgi:hypothetical protein
MTAHEALYAFQAAGGILTVDGAEIRFSCPRAAGTLVNQVRAVRGDVLAILHQRAIESVLGWSREYCVASSNARSNPRILYREYLLFRCDRTFDLTYSGFVTTLVSHVHLAFDAEGMVMGLCLAGDFACGRTRAATH